MATDYRRIPATWMPKPHYRCAGKDTFRVSANDHTHPRDDGGFRKAGELFWVTLRDPECEEECTDFFCQECLEALGKKTGGKKTLADAILVRTQDALEEAQRKILQTLQDR